MSFGTHADLFIEIENGCTERRKEEIVHYLYKKYTPLIHNVAWGYSTLTHNDAFCAALSGFMDSIDKFEYIKDVDFAFYSMKYMRSACQKAYRDNRVIHIPHNRQHEYELAVRANLFNKPQDELNEDERKMLEDLADVIPILQCANLDAPLDEGGKTLGDVKAQNTFNSPDHDYYLGQVNSSLERLMGKLPIDERLALIYFNGLFGEEEKTAREIGSIIGKSHQGAINTRIRAESKLKELLLEEENLVDSYSLEGIKCK
jgi:RNA polymerase sigma factor (sigma-70 family)